jgi:hypothetical protein
MVVASSFRRDFYRVQCGKVFVGELGDVHRASIQVPQTLIFLGGQQHDIVAAMTGDYDCFAVGNTP